MKRWIILLLMMLLGMSISIAHAKPTTVRLAHAFFADQIPAGADFYVAIRTDDAYIAELDNILTPIFAQLSNFEGIVAPNYNLSQLLDMLVQPTTGGDFATTVRPWLGASLAIAIYLNPNKTEAQNLFIAIDHSNRELAQATLENLLPRQINVVVEGDFTIYSPSTGLGFASINDDAIYITAGRGSTAFTGVTGDVLGNQANFHRSVGALPAPSYNIVFTADTASLVQVLDNDRSDTARLIRNLLPDAYTAVGATILDGVSPTIDVAQIGLTSSIISLISTPLDATFLQNVPSNVTGIIHGTNLLAPYNTIIDLLSAQTGEDLRAQLDQIQGLFGFDVIDLLLSDDFAIYFTYKPQQLAEVIDQQLSLLNTDPYGIVSDLTALIEFGYIIELSNPSNGQALIDQIASLYAMLGANSASGIAINRERIGNSNALILSLTTSPNGMLDLVIGANERVFVIGTRDSAEAILTGRGGFNTNPHYQNSLRYTLPTMTHYWFIDRASLSAAMSFIRLGLEPQITKTLDDFSLYWDHSPSSVEIDEARERARQQTRQRLSELLAMQEPLSQLAQLFDSATLSVTTKEGVLFLRAVITLSQ